MSDPGDVPINDAEMDQQEDEKEVTDLMDAVPKVLKKALMHDGLVCGLHEVAKALNAKRVLCCFLSANCSEPVYRSLVKALCSENNVPLVDVPDSKQLGQWAGLCKIDKEGQPRKIVGAGCVAITDYGEESPAMNFLLQYLKSPS